MINSKKGGLIISYIYFVLNTVLGIFISSFIVKAVGKTDYGVYQSMTAFVSYLVLLEFGTGTLMARNLSLLKKDGTDGKAIQKNVSTIWTLTFFLALIIFAFAILFYFLIPIIYKNSLDQNQILLGKRLFCFAVFSLLCSFFQQTLNGVLLGNEIYSFEKIVLSLKLILRSTLIVVFLSLRPNIYYLVTIDSIMSFLVLAVTFVFIKIKFKYSFGFSSFDKVVFLSALPLCFAMLLQTVVNTINGSLDKFLISIMMTPDDVAVYSIAMTMFTMFSSIATLPVSIFKPQIAKDISNGKQGMELANSLIEPCRINIIITGLIAFGFLSVGKQFIFILYGTDYYSSWVCALLVILPTFLNMSNAVLLNVLDVINKRQISSLIAFGATILNCAMTIPFISLFGMIGAAVATCVSILIQFLLLNCFYSKKIGIPIIHLFIKSFRGILIPLLLSFGVSFGISYLIDSIHLQFFICGFTFLAVFTLLFLFGMNDVERSFLRKIFKRHIKR